MAAAQIIIADDEPAISAFVAEALVDEGYSVHVFDNGLSALDAIQRSEPQLALLDVAMPVMTGDETLRQLRAAGSTLPVIMMTAGTNPERLLHEGADQVLAKPFDLCVLLDTVFQTLVRRNRLLMRGIGDSDVGRWQQ